MYNVVVGVMHVEIGLEKDNNIIRWLEADYTKDSILLYKKKKQKFYR